eukprot:7385877-Prymnesium_polylepis.1
MPLGWRMSSQATCLPGTRTDPAQPDWRVGSSVIILRVCASARRTICPPTQSAHRMITTPIQTYTSPPFYTPTQSHRRPDLKPSL